MVTVMAMGLATTQAQPRSHIRASILRTRKIVNTNTETIAMEGTTDGKTRAFVWQRYAPESSSCHKADFPKFASQSAVPLDLDDNNSQHIDFVLVSHVEAAGMSTPVPSQLLRKQKRVHRCTICDWVFSKKVYLTDHSSERTGKRRELRPLSAL